MAQDAPPLTLPIDPFEQLHDDGEPSSVEEARATLKGYLDRIPTTDTSTTPGAPSKLIRSRVRTLLRAVAAGSYLEPAGRLAGIDYNTIRKWINRADDPDADDRYVAFRDALHYVEAHAEMLSVQRVRAASAEPRNWTAAMTFLERRHRDRWSRGDTSAQHGASVQVVIGLALPGMPQAAQLTPSPDAQVIDAQVVTASLPQPETVNIMANYQTLLEDEDNR